MTTAPGWDLKATPYPQARRDETASKTYKSKKQGEVEVKEPYIWLETPPSQSPETKIWVTEQAAFTQKYIDQNPDREEFKKKIEENYSYPRIGLPVLKRNGKYYLHYNSGLDPQSTIYEATQEEVDSIDQTDRTKPPGRPWFDCNLLSKDGTTALSNTRFSHSGKLVAYGISGSGSDWETIYFRKTESAFVKKEGSELSYDATAGPDRLQDVVEDVKFDAATWTHDDKGVFYQAYPKPKVAAENFSKGTETDANVDAKLFYHRIGTKQSEDVLVIDKDPKIREASWHAGITDDGRYLLILGAKDTDPKQKIFLADLEGQEIGPNLKWVSIAGDYKYELSLLGNDGNRFYWSEFDCCGIKRFLSDTEPIRNEQGCPEWKDCLH